MTKAESRRLELLFGPEAEAEARGPIVQRFEDGQWWTAAWPPLRATYRPSTTLGAADSHWKLEKGVLTLKLATRSAGPVVRFVMEHAYKQSQLTRD